jgi:hypothetical protein
MPGSRIPQLVHYLREEGCQKLLNQLPLDEQNWIARWREENGTSAANTVLAAHDSGTLEDRARAAKLHTLAWAVQRAFGQGPTYAPGTVLIRAVESIQALVRKVLERMDLEEWDRRARGEIPWPKERRLALDKQSNCPAPEEPDAKIAHEQSELRQAEQLRPVADAMGRPPATDNAVRAEMRARVAGWPDGERAPDEEADFEAVSKNFAPGSLSRDDFRIVRRQETPDEWRKQGRRRPWGQAKPNICSRGIPRKKP